jgi:hypothetical protein
MVIFRDEEACKMLPRVIPTCRVWREVRFLPVAVSAAAPHHVSYSCDNSEADDIFFITVPRRLYFPALQ